MLEQAPVCDLYFHRMDIFCRTLEILTALPGSLWPQPPTLSVRMTDPSIPNCHPRLSANGTWSSFGIELSTFWALSEPNWSSNTISSIVVTISFFKVFLPLCTARLKGKCGLSTGSWLLVAVFWKGIGTIGRRSWAIWMTPESRRLLAEREQQRRSTEQLLDSINGNDNTIRQWRCCDVGAIRYLPCVPCYCTCLGTIRANVLHK